MKSTKNNVTIYADKKLIEIHYAEWPPASNFRNTSKMKKSTIITPISGFWLKFIDLKTLLRKIKQVKYSLLRNKKITNHAELEINSMLSLPGTMSQTNRSPFYGDLAQSAQTPERSKNKKFHLQDGL